MTWNPSHKFTQKIKNEMLITFVDRQLIDIGYKLDAILAEAASSCCQSKEKSVSCSQHFFCSFCIVTTCCKTFNEFDQLAQSKKYER